MVPLGGEATSLVITTSLLLVTVSMSQSSRQKQVPLSAKQLQGQRGMYAGDNSAAVGTEVRERNAASESAKQRTLQKERKMGTADEHANDGFCELEITCKQDGDIRLTKLPIHGARGPPGPQGSPGRHGEDGLPGLPGFPGLSAPVPRRVAFFVGLSDNLGPVKEQTVVVFDRVVTNIGESYDAKTGKFTAPVNGTYQFNVVISAQGRQKAAVSLVKNGNMVATVWAESIPYWATSCNVAVLSLDRDDQVWLLLLSRASFLHGYMYTTMSGFMIFEN